MFDLARVNADARRYEKDEMALREWYRETEEEERRTFGDRSHAGFAAVLDVEALALLRAATEELRRRMALPVLPFDALNILVESWIARHPEAVPDGRTPA